MAGSVFTAFLRRISAPRRDARRQWFDRLTNRAGGRRQKAGGIKGVKKADLV